MAAFVGDEVEPMANHLLRQEGYVTKGLLEWGAGLLGAVEWATREGCHCEKNGRVDGGCWAAEKRVGEAYQLMVRGFLARLQELSGSLVMSESEH